MKLGLKQILFREPLGTPTVQQYLSLMFQRSAWMGFAIALVWWVSLSGSGVLSEMMMSRTQFICWLFASVLTAMSILFGIIGLLLRWIQFD